MSLWILPLHVNPSLALYCTCIIFNWTPLFCLSGSSHKILPLLVPYCFNHKHASHFSVPLDPPPTCYLCQIASLYKLQLHPILLSFWTLPQHVTPFKLPYCFLSQTCIPLFSHSGSSHKMLPLLVPDSTTLDPPPTCLPFFSLVLYMYHFQLNPTFLSLRILP